MRSVRHSGTSDQVWWPERLHGVLQANPRDLRTRSKFNLLTRTNIDQFVRGWNIAMVQYSSLCEGAAVISLGADDIGDEVLGRVQVECGREEANDGEKQEKDRTRKQPTDNSNTLHGWHENGMTRAYRHVGWLVLSHAVSMHI